VLFRSLYKQQTPAVLETLRQVAIIQSTESSNRIEGVIVPAERIKELVEQKATPRNRSEQEVAGYRDVLNTIHANHPHMPFTPNVVLQLHRDLYQFVPQQGGRWKATNNEIAEILPDGTRIVRFLPVPAHLTPAAMNRLHERFDELWDRGEIDPLLLIATYVFDFLCIHPFTDGNGRMARLLTLLLLYRAGYEVGRYVSLEKIVENHDTGYYNRQLGSKQPLEYFETLRDDAIKKEICAAVNQRLAYCFIPGRIESPDFLKQFESPNFEVFLRERALLILAELERVIGASLVTSDEIGRAHV